MAYAGVASAANRTVAFAGTAFSNFRLLDSKDRIRESYCVVTVANTGGAAQQIRSVSMSTISPTNTTETSNTNVESDLTVSMIANPPGGSTCTPGSCWGTSGQIDPGGVYVVAVKVYPIGNSNINVNPCFGRITVYDVNESQLGSVVAAGAIGDSSAVRLKNFLRSDVGLSPLGLSHHSNLFVINGGLPF